MARALLSEPARKAQMTDHNNGGDRAMVFEITYRNDADLKDDRPRRPQSCFMEKDAQPDWAEIVELVNRLSGGKFQQDSINVEICSAFDIQVVRNLEIPIYRSNAVQGEARAA